MVVLKLLRHMTNRTLVRRWSKIRIVDEGCGGRAEDFLQCVLHSREELFVVHPHNLYDCWDVNVGEGAKIRASRALCQGGGSVGFALALREEAERLIAKNCEFEQVALCWGAFRHSPFVARRGLPSNARFFMNELARPSA